MRRLGVPPRAIGLGGDQDFRMPPTGLEPVAYCLGGSRSIHLSYGGEATNVATRRQTINGCPSSRP